MSENLSGICAVILAAGAGSRLGYPNERGGKPMVEALGKPLLAYGLERLCMLLTGRESIKDVIAFPKVQNASELMSGAPSAVSEKALEELGIRLAGPEGQEK